MTPLGVREKFPLSFQYQFGLLFHDETPLFGEPHGLSFLFSGAWARGQGFPPTTGRFSKPSFFFRLTTLEKEHPFWPERFP